MYVQNNDLRHACKIGMLNNKELSYNLTGFHYLYRIMKYRSIHQEGIQIMKVARIIPSLIERDATVAFCSQVHHTSEVKLPETADAHSSSIS